MLIVNRIHGFSVDGHVSIGLSSVARDLSHGFSCTGRSSSFFKGFCGKSERIPPQGIWKVRWKFPVVPLETS